MVDVIADQDSMAISMYKVWFTKIMQSTWEQTAPALVANQYNNWQKR